MLIITRGTVPETKVYRKTCNHCKSVIEFQKKEAAYSPDPKDTNVMFVNCPVCCHDVYFNVE